MALLFIIVLFLFIGFDFISLLIRLLLLIGRKKQDGSFTKEQKVRMIRFIIMKNSKNNNKYEGVYYDHE
jgi:hypothetical protein